MHKVVEPRIEVIKNEIQRILSLINLEKKGRPIKIDGFRLRDLESWKTGIAQNIFDVLGPYSGSCNAKCVFCMERSLPFQRDGSYLTLKEASTRLKYYSSSTGKCLFPSVRPHMETFLNKDTTQILKKARKTQPEELFILTTNGSTLTHKIILQLKEIKPLLIKYSVNSTDTSTRKALMGLKNNINKVLEHMNLLKEAEIPFTGSIVAWPSLNREDIERSLHDIASCSPYGIRIRLPLVHNYTPIFPQENLEKFWGETYDFINSIKYNFDVPVWIEPIQYGRTPVIPFIDGVIKNSPAFMAGLRSGDRIVSIDDKAISSRFEVRLLFSSSEFRSKDSIIIRIQRGIENITFRLSSSSDEGLAYPYNKDLNHPGEQFGILLLPDFDIGFLDNVCRLAEKHNSKQILLFASPLTAGTVETLIENLPPYKDFFDTRDLLIYSLSNTCMGGNTAMLDSRFVEDYEQAIHKVCQGLQDTPDLILIPDCFGSPWGIDFHGRSVFGIESNVNIPIELIPWHYIYGRED